MFLKHFLISWACQIFVYCWWNSTVSENYLHLNKWYSTNSEHHGARQKPPLRLFFPPAKTTGTALGRCALSVRSSDEATYPRSRGAGDGFGAGDRSACFRLSNRLAQRKEQPAISLWFFSYFCCVDSGHDEWQLPASANPTSSAGQLLRRGPVWLEVGRAPRVADLTWR
jgi:hypothetical protein